jgi:hypothetical protein
MRRNARPAREAAHSTVNGLLRSVITDSLPGWLNAMTMSAGNETSGRLPLALALPSGLL